MLCQIETGAPLTTTSLHDPGTVLRPRLVRQVQLTPLEPLSFTGRQFGFAGRFAHAAWSSLETKRTHRHTAAN